MSERFIFPERCKSCVYSGALRAERAVTSVGITLKRTVCAAVRLTKTAPVIDRAKDKPQNADLLLRRIKK